MDALMANITGVTLDTDENISLSIYANDITVSKSGEIDYSALDAGQQTTVDDMKALVLSLLPA